MELKCLIAWPDDIALCQNMPKCFKKHYSKVKCIIDCFEIFIKRPVSFQARAATYSNYKKHNTLKVLVAIAPTGSICFISKAWGGRVSDKVIMQKCGFLHHIKYGDVILADRGFNIHDDLAVIGASLQIPAFTKGKTQLPKKDLETTRKLAQVRIHVERVIDQLRKKYKILQNTLPINLIKCPSDDQKTVYNFNHYISSYKSFTFSYFLIDYYKHNFIHVITCKINSVSYFSLQLGQYQSPTGAHFNPTHRK